jgi:transcriptional regulator with XRE-family HTH domain
MNLRQRREAAGLSLHKLADKSGVNYMKIHQIEHEKIKPENITLRTAMKLAGALRCTPEELLKGESNE